MNKIYACSNCGVSETNRSDWCDLGCGSDYNEMIDVGGRRFIEYSTKIKKTAISPIIEMIKQQVNDLRNAKIDHPVKVEWNDALEQSACKLESLIKTFKE
jgi:hypothetical protein